MNPSLKQKLKRIVKISLITAMTTLIILFVVLFIYNDRSPRPRSKVAEFKSQASSMQHALVIEGDKPNPNPTSLVWSDDATVGSITTPLACSADGEISGGVVTANPTSAGICVGTIGQTGVTFVGADC